MNLEELTDQNHPLVSIYSPRANSLIGEGLYKDNMPVNEEYIRSFGAENPIDESYIGSFKKPNIIDRWKNKYFAMDKKTRNIGLIIAVVLVFVIILAILLKKEKGE